MVAVAAGLLLAAAPPTATSTPTACPVAADPWAADATARVVRASRSAELAALEAYAFALDGPDAARRGLRTDAVVIVHRGHVTYERYARGQGPETRHVAWSVTKSAVGALAAIAIGERAVSLDDSICRHLAAAPRAHCGITVRHLLEWSSGLDWRETYEGSRHQASSVLAMLYGVGRADMVSFVLGHAARAEPGAQWAYSSGDSLLLAAVLDAAMAPRHGRDWPWAVLFDPAGMRSAVLERDARRTFVGASYLWATPRDLARLGLLYLHDGCAGERRLWPAGWLRLATEPSAAVRRGSPFRKRGDVTGLALWLNRSVPELGQGPPWPGAPDDAFWMRGHWGQLVAVIPSLELVVVRTGDDREEDAFDHDRFLALAIAAGRLP
jgi:CubicO group peptidase (beta-lactamase class C family)